MKADVGYKTETGIKWTKIPAEVSLIDELKKLVGIKFSIDDQVNYGQFFELVAASIFGDSNLVLEVSDSILDGIELSSVSYDEAEGYMYFTYQAHDKPLPKIGEILSLSEMYPDEEVNSKYGFIVHQDSPYFVYDKYGQVYLMVNSHLADENASDIHEMLLLKQPFVPSRFEENVVTVLRFRDNQLLLVPKHEEELIIDILKEVFKEV